MTKCRNINRPRTIWTAEKETMLRAQYPHRKADQIAADLRFRIEAVYAKAYCLGLTKSQEFLNSDEAGRIRPGCNTGKGFRFSKGHVPANKGLRRPGFSPGRMGETQFKKGRPACDAINYKPIGSYRINKAGHLEKKVTDDPNIYPARRWIPVYRLVWEAENGPIPKGHLVRFKPGMSNADLDLITIDKLECVSRIQHMKDHTFHNYGPDIAKLMQLRSAISRQINMKGKP